MLQERNSPYRLLSLDMDGTLLDSALRIPLGVIEAIDKLIAADVWVVIGSGRGHGEMSDYREALKRIPYGILLNGGLVYDFQREKTIVKHPLPLDKALAMLSAAEEEDAMVQVMTTYESVSRPRDVERMPELGMGRYQPLYRKICLQREDLKAFITENAPDVIKMNVYHKDQASRDRSYAQISGLGLAVALAESTGWEATLAGVTKGTGLKELCQHLDLPLKNCVAVGDGENDLSILRTVGKAVAMGNAISSVKSMADFVTADNDHEGVRIAIEHYWP